MAALSAGVFAAALIPRTAPAEAEGPVEAALIRKFIHLNVADASLLA